MKKRTIASFVFQNSKVSLYDFDSEQYRSSIRHSYVKVQGVRGEIFNDEILYLNENNEAKKETLHIQSETVETGNDNPNLREYEEVRSIMFKGKTVYEAPFGSCSLSRDETAVTKVLKNVGDCLINNKEEVYPLAESLQDAYMTILLRTSVEEKRTVASEPMLWQKSVTDRS